MGDEADYLIEKQIDFIGYQLRKGIRPAKRTPSAAMNKVLAAAEAAEADEGPREPSTRTTCNRCGTARLHWTGDKQAGTLVMRDEHGFVHECKRHPVNLNLGVPAPK